MPSSARLTSNERSVPVSHLPRVGRHRHACADLRTAHQLLDQVQSVRSLCVRPSLKPSYTLLPESSQYLKTAFIASCAPTASKPTLLQVKPALATPW